MKTFKRFAALLIAAMMVIGTVVPAMAQDAGGEAPAPVTISVTYDANGGVLPEGLTNPMTKSVAAGKLATFDLTAKPTHPDGKYFAGWGTSATATVAFPSISTASDMTVYAIWANQPPKDVTLTFEKVPATDATVEVPASLTIKIPAGKDETKANVSGYSASRNGFDFLGWSETEVADYALDADTTAFTPAGEITLTADKTVYPVWKEAGPTTGKVIYNYAGGKVGQADYYEDTISIPAGKTELENYNLGKTGGASDGAAIATPTKGGMTFFGWAEAPTDNVAITAPQTVTDGKTFYALYEEEYTVKYNNKGGAGTFADESGKIEAGTDSDEFTLSVTGPTYEGFNFTGWSTEEVDVGTPISTKPTIKVTDDMIENGVVNVYAVYAKNPTNADYADVDNDGEADDKVFTISVNKDDTHTYNVYQVLTGTIGDDPDRLGDPKWGEDSIYYGFTADTWVPADHDGVTWKTAQEWIDSIKDLTYDDPEISRQITAILKKNADGSLPTPTATSIDGNKTVDNGDGTGKVGPYRTVPGYYIMVDTTSPLEEGDILQPNIVQVVSNVTVKIKKEVPSVDKNIVEDTLGENDYRNFGEEGTKVDDISIGDSVTFEIKATVPSRADDYDYFFFIINDTLDKGLDLLADDGETVYSGDGNGTSIVLYKEGANDANVIPASEYTVKVTTENVQGAEADTSVTPAVTPHTTLIRIALKDAIAHKGETIVVRYQAKLNKYAEVNEDPNNNTVNLTYSNNPNHEYDGDKDDDDSGFPRDEEHTPLGEGPDVITESYSTELELLKVDENGNVLTGAEFQLTGASMKEVYETKTEFLTQAQASALGLTTTEADFTYYKLNTGLYTEEAPVIVDYMRALLATEDPDDGCYVEDATATPGVDDAIQMSDGKIYRPYVPATDTNIANKYILVRANTAEYAELDENGNATKMYMKHAAIYRTPVLVNNEVKQFVDSFGIAQFEGLGSGTYTLTETTTPEGFNTIDPITFTIVFNKDADPKWSVQDVSSGVEYDANAKQFKVTVENKKGTKLPETGGIGTTLFYMGGAILVLLAGVLLVSKRRMA